MRASGLKRARTSHFVLSALAFAYALVASPSHAGTYEVTTCSNATGAAQTAFVATAERGMAAYSTCPNTPSNPASGLVTRASATAGAGSVPYFAGAYQIFEAPPGATLETVSFDVAAIRMADYWTTGVIAYDGDFNVGGYPYGCYAGHPGCGIGTRAFVGPVTADLRPHTKFRFETRCVSLSGCDISAAPGAFGMRAMFSAANVRVRVNDATAPSVTPSWGPLFSGGWLRDSQDGWSLEYDNVGVMVNRTSIDGRVVYAEDYREQGWPGWVRCDFTRPRPCTDIPGAISRVDTRRLSDGEHQLQVEVIDAAGNYASAARRIKVDNTAPPRVNASVEGGDGWRTRNGFAIRWQAPGGQVSPVKVAHYRLCSVTAGSSSCVVGSRPAAGIERMDNVTVPAAGDYTLSVWLEDEAGNADSGTASDPVRLRFDDQRPQAAFEFLNESDPTKLDVRTADAVSGVADGAIEFRRTGWRQWHGLQTSLHGDGHLSARLDDLDLPDDTYELRARVRDRAGNELTSYEREDGARMTLNLPLRATSHIALEKARQKGRLPAELSGTLRGRSGRPLAGAAINVFEQPRTGGGFRETASLRTNASGKFTHVLRAGPSRTVSVRYAGSALIKPAMENIAIRVPARTTIRANRRSLRNGQSVRLGGRLRGGPVPDGGKLIDLQAFYRGQWRTFATPRSDGRGRWSFRYRFEATRGTVRYRFRARIRREAAYPYELGYSRVIGVTVRGP
jgi:hypothetical protein